MKRLSLAMIALVFSIFALGCNTMEGVGEDVEAGGEAIEETANDAR